METLLENRQACVPYTIVETIGIQVLSLWISGRFLNIILALLLSAESFDFFEL